MMIHEYDIIKTFYEVESRNVPELEEKSMSIIEQKKLLNDLHMNQAKIVRLKEKLKLAKSKIDYLQSQSLLQGEKSRVVDLKKRCLFDEMLAF